MRSFPASGGLFSYGMEPAGDLPVQAPTKYELVINLIELPVFASATCLFRSS